MKRTLFQALISVVAVTITVMQVHADPVSLTNGNSTLQLDTTSSLGVYSWTVDGVGQLSNQSLWWRIGATGGESAINELTPGVMSFTPSTASTSYSHSQFDATVSYALIGGPFGSGQSTLTQGLTITNTGSTALDLHLFQYIDLDVGGFAANNTVTITGGNTIRQTGLNPSQVMATAGLRANFWEAALYSDLLDSLTSGNPTSLTGLNFIFGDGTFALQWDVTLAPSQPFSVAMTDTASAVPLPSSIHLFGPGGLLFLGLMRRRRKGFTSFQRRRANGWRGQMN